MDDRRTSAGDTLSSRTISAFPISISTSLAFESIFSPRLKPYDPLRVIPEQIDVSKYQEIYINLSTLFRNIVSSITREAFHNASALDIKETLVSEIDVINSLFLTEGSGVCRPIYYYCTYKNFTAKLPDGIALRTDKTDGQRFYRHKNDEVMKLIFKSTDEHFEFDHEIKPQQRNRSLILTHYPYELLSYNKFTQLDLLESNTGKLKSRHQWNSKYYNVGDSDLSCLPFTRKLLLIFGDRVLIQPSDIKLRRLILEIAQRRKWTALTTTELMMFDFELEIKEPFVLQFIKKL